MRLTQSIYSLAIMAAIGAASLTAGKKAVGQAEFSSFVYIGNDDYYNANPLKEDGDFYNPVIAGWYSDPSVVRTGEDYYLVTSTFGYFPGVPLYHSRDLVNWRLVRNILDRPEQLPGLVGQSLDRGGIYAPQISYNPHNSTYYMITTDVGSKEGHFYVTATDPEGSWSNPVWLKGIDGIDPSLFFDDDGSAYIVYKEDTTGRPKWSNYRCIRFIAFDPESGRTVGDSWPLAEAGVGPEEHLDRDEGPHIYKIDGRYFLICAEGGTSNHHSAVIYRADSLRGEFTRWSRNPALTQRYLKDKRTNPITCTGHADLVMTPEGEWWGVFLGCRPGPGGFQALGRETYLMPVKWSRDGFPYFTQSQDTVPLTLHREGVKHDPSWGSSGNFTWSDDFKGESLRPEWIGLRGTTADYCHLDGECLRMQCCRELSTGKGVPAYVGRRIQHHKFEASTRVRFKPRNGGESAGLLMLKNESRQYYLAVCGDRVELRTLSPKEVRVIASAEMPCKAGRDVELRVVSDGICYDFYVREAARDAEWTPVAEDVDASYLACERTGGFTGATIGLYAESRD